MVESYNKMDTEGMKMAFADEIEGWIIDALKSIGCDTAKSVLSIEAEELVKRTDLEIETIKEVIEILKKEFE
jgi:N utilization substance protein A